MNYNLEQTRNEMFGRAGWRGGDELAGWWGGPDPKQLKREQSLLREERIRERARIARELHDTLLQGFLGASLVLHDAVQQMPADSPSKSTLSRALELMYRVIDEGRVALQGLRSSPSEFGSLEQALSDVANEFTGGPGGRFRLFVLGKPKALKRTIEEQVYLIAREALINALRHSAATSVEAEVEYLRGRIRVVIRDNGSGIDPEVLRSGRDSHWGLLGMRERARSIGAQLKIWSRRGAGTEVEISIPCNVATDAVAYVSNPPTLQKAAVA